MDKQKARRIVALMLVIFIGIIFSSAIFFAIKGNVGAFVGLISFNTVFVVIVYFLLRMNRYVHSDSEIDEDEIEEGEEIKTLDQEDPRV